MRVYLVGGAVRDMLLGRPLHDFDFAVEAESFEAMREGLREQFKLKCYIQRPEFVTLRGTIVFKKAGAFGLPDDVCWHRVDADFTLCRAEKMYHDKRHPSKVTPASIEVDLKRRDFTINAVTVSEDGHINDFGNGGILDATFRRLRTVGDAEERFTEDPLRILRGVRFAVNLNLDFDEQIIRTWNMPEIVDGLKTVHLERVREELARVKDWYALMSFILIQFPLLGATLNELDRLWFKPTLEER